MTINASYAAVSAKTREPLRAVAPLAVEPSSSAPVAAEVSASTADTTAAPVLLARHGADVQLLQNVGVPLSPQNMEDLEAIRQRVLEEGGEVRVGSPGTFYETLNFYVEDENSPMIIEYYGFRGTWEPGSDSVTFDNYQSDFQPLNEVVDGMRNQFDREMDFRLPRELTQQAFDKIDELRGDARSIRLSVNVDQGTDTPEPLEIFYRSDGTLFFGEGGNTGQLRSYRDGDGEGNFNIMQEAVNELLDGNYTILSDEER